MAQTYSSKGKVFLTQNQFDSRKDAGTLQTGVEYMIIDDPNTIKLSDGSISLLASNGVMIIGKSAEEPYLTIGPGNQVLVDNPTVDQQVANKKYVDDLINTKQNTLFTTAPIQITEDNNIKLNYDTETLLVAENKLSVKAEGLVGWGLSASSDKLNVNVDTIGSDLAGTGLNYDSSAKSLIADTYTEKLSLEGSQSIPIDSNQLITLRSSSVASITFNNTSWVELTVTKTGESNYTGWGIYYQSSSGTLPEAYVYTLINSTDASSVTVSGDVIVTKTVIN